MLPWHWYNLLVNGRQNCCRPSGPQVGNLLLCVCVWSSHASHYGLANRWSSTIYIILIVITSSHKCLGILMYTQNIDVSGKNIHKIKRNFQINSSGVLSLPQSGIKQEPQAQLVIFNLKNPPDWLLEMHIYWFIPF